jgi:hypothetical protein
MFILKEYVASGSTEPKSSIYLHKHLFDLANSVFCHKIFQIHKYNFFFINKHQFHYIYSSLWYQIGNFNMIL